MKKSLIVFLSVFSLQVSAQDSAVHKNSSYLLRGAELQYAGSFGMVSGCALFVPFKKLEKLEVGAGIGYTPPAYGNLWTANLLISCKLFQFKYKKLTFDPIIPGIFVNFNFGKNIYIAWPEQYPANYYWWNSSIRYGPFINSELNYKISDKKSVTYFFRVLTNDLYLYTYLPNTRFIKFSDILVFGTGIKYYFQ